MRSNDGLLLTRPITSGKVASTRFGKRVRLANRGLGLMMADHHDGGILTNGMRSGGGPLAQAYGLTLFQRSVP